MDIDKLLNGLLLRQDMERLSDEVEAAERGERAIVGRSTSPAAFGAHNEAQFGAYHRTFNDVERLPRSGGGCNLPSDWDKKQKEERRWSRMKLRAFGYSN